MGTEDVSAAIRGLMEDAVGTLMDQFMPKQALPRDWDLQGLAEALARDFDTRVDPKAWLAAEPQLEEQVLRERLLKAVGDTYEAKVTRIGAPTACATSSRRVMLEKLDQHWREHLAAMDYLRQGIHLRGYAQKDYRFEFKREAFDLFAAMLERIKFETASTIADSRCAPRGNSTARKSERRERLMRALQAQHAEARLAPRRRRLTQRPRHRSRAGPCAPLPAALGARSAPPPPPASEPRAPSCATSARSGATSRAPAARGRSTSTATACSRASSSRAAALP